MTAAGGGGEGGKEEGKEGGVGDGRRGREGGREGGRMDVFGSYLALLCCFEFFQSL